MPWIEGGAGFDISPCHDADGTWNPDERCRASPLAPHDGSQTSESWANGPSATCGTPFSAEPGETTSTGGAEGGTMDTSSCGPAPDDDDGEGDTSSGGLLSGGTASDDTGGPEPRPDPEDEGSSGVSEDAPGADSNGEGCGCHSSSGGGWQALLAFGLLGLRRRVTGAVTIARVGLADKEVLARFFQLYLYDSSEARGLAPWIGAAHWLGGVNIASGRARLLSQGVWRFH